MRPHPHPSRHFALLTAAALILALALAVPASARPLAQAEAAPPNDYFASAVELTSFPDTRSYDLSIATLEEGEPNYWITVAHSVWYRLSVTQGAHIRVSTANSADPPVPVVLDLYYDYGYGIQGLNWQGTTTDSVSTYNLHEGGAYYLRVGATADAAAGTTTVTIEIPAPPSNDNFAAATPLDAPPIDLPVSAVGATMEPGEPTPPCGWPTQRTVWLAFTAPETDVYAAEIFSWASAFLGIYAGTTLSDLTLMGANCGGISTFSATAGTTYYLQLGTYNDAVATIGLRLYAAPDPQVSINLWPEDPSIYDDIGLSGWVYDPASQEVASWRWSFGDGTTSDEPSPSHRYAADGAYTVSLAVTMRDGRMGEASREIVVSTYDVAITKFSVPQTARAGQTRSIVVGVSNLRDEVTVSLYLYKGVGSGRQLITVTSVVVPPRSANRTTNFPFIYTFTAEDARLGKVTFSAMAVIEGRRDAIPADNELIAPPTRVAR